MRCRGLHLPCADEKRRDAFETVGIDIVCVCVCVCVSGCACACGCRGCRRCRGGCGGCNCAEFLHGSPLSQPKRKTSGCLWHSPGSETTPAGPAQQARRQQNTWKSHISSISSASGDWHTDQMSQMSETSRLWVCRYKILQAGQWAAASNFWSTLERLLRLTRRQRIMTEKRFFV